MKMTTAMKRAHARHRLDSSFEESGLQSGVPRPHSGWIRGIRDALGMSGTHLGARLGVSQQAIADLERSEQRETIRLDTLRRAADALDCDLVYALVPRTSLDEAVRQQAKRRAARLVDAASHQSRLEDQEVSSEDTDQMISDLAGRFLDRRDLWS